MHAELRDAYASGELVAFVGAGVSASAGLPSRRALVEHLIEYGRGYGLYPAQLEQIEELVREGELIDALSDIEAAIGARAFTRTVTRALDDDGRPPSPLANSIAALTQLRGVVTTNLDRLLERALGGRWPCHVRPVANLVQTRGWLFKLHGTLPERETWVLTRAEYQRAIYNDPLHLALVQALFLATPLLFVGCSLDDPDFMAVVDRIQTLAQGQQLPSHFALLDEAEASRRRRRRLEAAGIQVISYQDPDGAHAERSRLLLELAGG